MFSVPHCNTQVFFAVVSFNNLKIKAKKENISNEEEFPFKSRIKFLCFLKEINEIGFIPFLFIVFSLFLFFDKNFNSCLTEKK